LAAVTTLQMRWSGCVLEHGGVASLKNVGGVG